LSYAVTIAILIIAAPLGGLAPKGRNPGGGQFPLTGGSEAYEMWLTWGSPRERKGARVTRVGINTGSECPPCVQRLAVPVFMSVPLGGMGQEVLQGGQS